LFDLKQSRVFLTASEKTEPQADVTLSVANTARTTPGEEIIGQHNAAFRREFAVPLSYQLL
jgi:hypothetical protein